MISISETVSQEPSISSLGIRLNAWAKYDADVTSRGLRQRPYRLFIRERIVLKGRNDKEIAESMGCEPGTVSKLLSGKMKMTLRWLAGFAYALDCELSDLFRDPAAPSQNELLKDVPEEKVRAFIEFVRKMTS